MSNWNAMSIQFAWFVLDVQNLNAAPIYTSLLGEEPETTQRLKSPTPASPFLSMAAGVLNNRQHQITVQQNRVDYIVQPASSDEIIPPLIEDTADVLDKAVACVRIAPITGTFRAAIILNLIERCSSHKVATSLLNEKIGSPVSFQDASDLQFQVNRRKNVPGSEINRLLRFSVPVFQMMNFSFNPQFARAAPTLGELYAVALTIDINTVLGDQALPFGDLDTIWKSMYAEATSLRRIGTIDGLLA